jgi:hypothetical protein
MRICIRRGERPERAGAHLFGASVGQRRPHRRELASIRTRLGRCNFSVAGSELTILLVAKFAPSRLATPPTDPIVFGDLVAPDAGTDAEGHSVPYSDHESGNRSHVVLSRRTLSKECLVR